MSQYGINRPHPTGQNMLCWRPTISGLCPPPLVGAPVRPNMLNMPKSASAYYLLTTEAICCSRIAPRDKHDRLHQPRVYFELSQATEAMLTRWSGGSVRQRPSSLLQGGRSSSTFYSHYTASDQLRPYNRLMIYRYIGSQGDRWSR